MRPEAAATIAADVTAIVERTGVGRHATTAHVEAALRALTPLAARLDAVAAFAGDHYTRTLVAAGPDWEVLVLGWLPGQGSPAHDHGSSLCGYRVLRGTGVENFWADEHVDAEPQIRIHHAGAVVVTEPGAAHQLACAPTPHGERVTPLVTVHLYAPPIRDGVIYPDHPHH